MRPLTLFPRFFGPAVTVAGLVFASGLLATPISAQNGREVRVIQTNSAGDDAHIIDPVTHRVVGVIGGLGKPHGVMAHPDGTRYYFTSEGHRSVEVVDSRTLQQVKRIPLEGTPHNPALSARAMKAYIALIDRPFIQVLDLRTEEIVGQIPTAGGVHNIFVTPDQRHVVAGMIGSRTMSVIDTETDQILWSIAFPALRGLGSLDDGGVRPMTIEANPDGTSKRIFVQVSGFHGFYVVDWETRALVQTIEIPPPPLSQRTSDGIQGAPVHGAAVTPDMTSLWAASRATGHVYGWSLPDLEFLGGVETGSPDWLTVTPDSRTLFVSVAGENETVAVDLRTRTVAAEIPVGQVPKRVQALEVAEGGR
ncbi:MAG: hypothetical protein WEG36_03095 [Gemmatimonadota bacterium]